MTAVWSVRAAPGFPSAVKLVVKDLDKIEAIIINGAECEPYVTSDTRTMLDRTDEVWEGILMLQEYYRAKRIIIAIEENKPECIQRFRALCENTQGIEVAARPICTPGRREDPGLQFAGPHHPGRQAAIDVGAVVINCTTLATITTTSVPGCPWWNGASLWTAPPSATPATSSPPSAPPERALRLLRRLQRGAGKVLYCGARWVWRSTA